MAAYYFYSFFSDYSFLVTPQTKNMREGGKRFLQISQVVLFSILSRKKRGIDEPILFKYHVIRRYHTSARCKYAENFTTVILNYQALYIMMHFLFLA